VVINIISTQLNRKRITGPKKVFDNACKGLDRMGVKYVLNKPLNEYKYNWIHDDSKAIIEAGFVGRPVLIGPNTAVLPKDLPILRKSLHSDSVYLSPSQWVIDMWKQSGFKECKMHSWPVGIDLDNFVLKKRTTNDLDKILIYFKQRDKNILNHTKQIVKDKNIEYQIIHYGFYKEEEYKKALNESKLCIWIGCSESQGIALQEALSTGMPMIVLDAKSLFDAVSENKKGYFDYKMPKSLDNIKVSSAPYFDDRCGVKINDIDKLSASIDYMLSNIDIFNPRDYIKENLSLEMASQSLVDKFSNLNINKKTILRDYKIVSKYLYYLDLLGKEWFYRWLLFKLKNTIWDIMDFKKK
jgi:glycosyltransferase involved in cell wall biosynthesis